MRTTAYTYKKYADSLNYFVSKLMLIFLIAILFSSTAQARSFIVSNNSQPSQTFLVVNGTTGYTGIGTGNPLYPLDVVGDIRWSGSLISGNVSWASLTNFPSACPAGFAVQAANNTDFTCVNLTAGTVQGSGTQNYIPYWISSLLMGDSNIQFVGGKVGISSSPITPVRMLDVVGDINATAGIYGDSIYQNGNKVLDNTSAISTYNSSYHNFWISNISAKTDYVNNATERALFTTTYNSTYGSYVIANISNITNFWDGLDTPLASWTDTYNSSYHNFWISNISAKTDYVNNATERALFLSTYNASYAQKGVDETITGNWVFQNNLMVGGKISYVNSETLNLNGSIIPPLDNWFSIGNSTNRWKNVSAISLYQGGNQVLDRSTAFGGNVSGNYNSIQLASGSVGTGQIIDGAITTSKIAPDLNLGWANLTDYPDDCGVGMVVKGLADGTLTCTAAGTGNISGGGNTNVIAKFTGAGTIGNSTIYESGGNVGVNTTTPQNTLNVIGTLNVTTGSSVLTLDSNGDLTFGI